jgi:methylmalonyl-CoA mutase cobalamin-binding subunit
VLAVENSVTACLQVIEDKLAVSESRFNLKATTGPIGLKAGNLLSMAVSASLRSVGFRSVNLGKSQTPLELLRNSEELGADLVVPLLSDDAVEEQLRSFIEAVERGGFKTKFEIIPVAPGLPELFQSSIVIARNSGEAISKATEWALKRQSQNRIK